MERQSLSDEWSIIHTVVLRPLHQVTFKIWKSPNLQSKELRTLQAEDKTDVTSPELIPHLQNEQVMISMTGKTDESLHLEGALENTGIQPTQPNDPGRKNQDPTPQLHTSFITCVPSPPMLSSSLQWRKE